MFAALITAAVDPDDMKDACGTQPGNACRWVMVHTGSKGWAEFVDTAVTKFLHIALILAIGWVINRLISRTIGRSADQVAGLAKSRRLRRLRVRKRKAAVLATTPGAPDERAAARAQTIAQVLRSITSFVVAAFVITYVLGELGLALGPLIAGVGVAGVALGFGAQSLVKDFLSGLFMLIEDQYGVGDVIDAGEAIGTVEEVSLRTTHIRDVNGTVWHVPNGQITRVGNKSQQWARAVVDVTVLIGTDVAHAEQVLADIAKECCERPTLRDSVIEPPEVWGVEALGPEGVTIRLAVRTRPGEQWMVMRALRLAIQDGFPREGIQLATPPGSFTLHPGSGAVPRTARDESLDPVAETVGPQTASESAGAGPPAAVPPPSPLPAAGPKPTQPPAVVAGSTPAPRPAPDASVDPVTEAVEPESTDEPARTTTAVPAGAGTAVTPLPDGAAATRPLGSAGGAAAPAGGAQPVGSDGTTVPGDAPPAVDEVEPVPADAETQLAHGVTTPAEDGTDVAGRAPRR